MKLIDVFMAFLVVVGGLQFVYCVLVGNYVRASIVLGSMGGRLRGLRVSQEGLIFFANELSGFLAVQCLSIGIQCNGGPIRVDG